MYKIESRLDMVPNKFDELFQSKDTVYIFDVDGVLARIEYGEYNHYYYDDEAWGKNIYKMNYYEDYRAIKTMQNFLSDKDMKRVYVCTKVMNEEEFRQKSDFLEKNYHIQKEHMYLVYKNEDKLETIKQIQKEYPNLEEKYFVLIDDSVDVLNHVMENSNFSTVHNSSFLP